MATIHKSRLPYRFYSYLDDNSSVSHYVNITDDVLSYKMESSFEKDSVRTTTVHFDFTLRLSILRAHHRFGEQTIWAFRGKASVEDLIGVPYDHADSVPYLCYNNDIRPVLDETWNIKGGRWDLIQSTYDVKTPVFYIFVPNADSTFSDMEYSIGVPFNKLESLQMAGYTNAEEIAANMEKGRLDTLQGVNVFVNEPHTWTNTTKPMPTFFAGLTAITPLANPAAGDTIPVTVTCANTKIGKIYLEGIHGALDRTEVVLTNGVGTFNILTNTLSSGDTVDVKIGYKSWSNHIRFTKTLA